MACRDGKDGKNGKNGKNGSPGLSGIAGISGITGTPGIEGLVGRSGIIGPIGPNGIPGKTNIVGPAGPNGISYTGPVGPVGPTSIGPTGSTGPIGSQGIEGPTGPINPSNFGAIGPTGPIGLQGSTGPSAILKLNSGQIYTDSTNIFPNTAGTDINFSGLSTTYRYNNSPFFTINSFNTGFTITNTGIYQIEANINMYMSNNQSILRFIYLVYGGVYTQICSHITFITVENGDNNVTYANFILNDNIKITSAGSDLTIRLYPVVSGESVLIPINDDAFFIAGIPKGRLPVRICTFNITRIGPI